MSGDQQDDCKAALRSIRNIGIIAHIDAGKTTVTERFLYYSGKTHRIGDVDAGNTVMDYLDEERRRGITITAAAASLQWTQKGSEKLIHLIDTPGHIDFTAEVERAIRVSDGAIVIFSGVEGVEAQSEKVWRQSEKYQVPKIAFINKLDRMGASYERTLEEIKMKFPAAAPAAFQLPLGIEDTLEGVIDLVEMKLLRFTGEDGALIKIDEIPMGMKDESATAREALIEALSDVSDVIAELYIEGKSISVETIHAEARKAVISGKLCPVFVGSARKNIGIQPLLDAVCLYLPSPFDRGNIQVHNPEDNSEFHISPEDKNFSALVFKVIAGGSADLLYTRTYSGTLKVSDILWNPRTKEKVRVKRILRLFAKNIEADDKAGAGDIIGITGPSNVYTGDTLCSVNFPVLLEKISFPEPVMSIAIEPKSSKDKEKLANCLELLCREDPTLSLQVHENTGQQLLSGMGELHLEINTNRIKNEFNIDSRCGEPQVAFKETIKENVSAAGIFNKVMGDNEYFAEVDFILEPSPKLERGIETVLNLKKKNEISKDWQNSALSALLNGLKTGGNWGYPLTYIKGTVTDIRGISGKTTESSVAGAVLDGLRKAVAHGTVLLEPLMRLEVISPTEYTGEITGCLQSMRAIIHGIENLPGSKRLFCEVPLSEMFGFSKSLPKLSGGRAAFSMEPCGYQEITGRNLERLAEKTMSLKFN
ncbi:MAG: hypothetical protein A2020_03945 [Lentisphaerae bacterium GWF2_45_14]|nr:MAG: hypothetical protein A2020_03945 [Lentisphaerae bacterium GWF2_45_14]